MDNNEIKRTNRKALPKFILLFAVCALIFNTGFLPSFAVCVIWFVLQFIYYRETIRYSKAGNRIS